MSRIVCRMDWASGDQSRIDDVIEFESRVDEVWRRYDDAVICTYHLATAQRGCRNRHHADAPYGHYWRASATKPFFHAS